MSLIKSAGHLLLATMFISGGSDAFIHPEGRAKKVETAGIPGPRQATILNGALMLLGGAMLALNIAPKLGSVILIGTLVPTTFVGHPYWKEESPAGATNQRVHFYKNLAMLGGLFVVLSEKK